MERSGRPALISYEVAFSNPADEGKQWMWTIIKALSVSSIVNDLLQARSN